MKQKILAIFMAMAGMLLSVSLAYAGQITSSHSVISAVPSATGGDVTLNITLTNSGASNMYAVEASEQSFLGGSDPAASKLIVGDILAGQATTLSWTITTTSNVEQLQPGTPVDLVLQVIAIDAAGNAITDDIISGGGM